jgi:hypothetical protein
VKYLPFCSSRHVHDEVARLERARAEFEKLALFFRSRKEPHRQIYLNLAGYSFAKPLRPKREGQGLRFWDPVRLLIRLNESARQRAATVVVKFTWAILPASTVIFRS